MGGNLQNEISHYVQDMPPLPASVGKILEICRSPQTNPQDLNKVISLDPVLLGRVMKLINSAYYALQQEVTSLVRAIIMLGVNTIKNLALSTAVLGTIEASTKNQSSKALNMDGFWRHCLAVGVSSKLIAKKRGLDPKVWEQYFICGLLHDIGKVPASAKLSQEYLQVLGESDKNREPLHQGEQRFFGADHQIFGSWVMEAWGLGPDLSDPIAFHHNPLAYQGEYKDLVFSVCVADYFCNIMGIGFGGNRHPLPPDDQLYQFLGLSWLDLEGMEGEVKNELNKAQVFLKL